MKKILLAAVLTVTALNSVMAGDKAKEPAEASRKIDLSTLTCGQFRSDVSTRSYHHFVMDRWLLDAKRR